MAIIDKVRLAVGHSTKEFDDDLLDTIEAARSDMIASGVPDHVANDEDNPLVTQAIKKYAQSEEAWEEPDIAQAQMDRYTRIVSKLAMSHRRKKT